MSWCAWDYKDLPETPEKLPSTTKTVASNAAHLARLLAQAKRRAGTPR